MEFNELVHAKDEHGDPRRNEDGTIRLKPSWKEAAQDRQGRTYNPKVHGDTHTLDEQGFLAVRRRDAGRKPMNTESRSEALVSKHRQPGYSYYLATEDRHEQFAQHDWEDVMDENGPVTLDGGQARNANTVLRLKKKPQEWYDEDQRAKEEARIVDFKANTKPKEGQYGEGVTSSKLR